MVQESLNDEWDRIWIGADIATMVAGAEPYGNLKNAALAVKGERIAWIGPAAEGARKAAALGVPIHDVQGLWMTPGLIDCHTHLVYGGNRVEEFEKRLCGVSYEDIARAGGGTNPSNALAFHRQCGVFDVAIGFRARDHGGNVCADPNLVPIFARGFLH